MTNPIAEAIAKAMAEFTESSPTKENCPCVLCQTQLLPYEPQPDALLLSRAPAALARNWGPEKGLADATLEEARTICLDSDRGLRLVVARILMPGPFIRSGQANEALLLTATPQAQIGKAGEPLKKTGRQFAQLEEFWAEVTALRNLLGFTWRPEKSDWLQKGRQFKFVAYFLRANEEAQQAVQA